jgi:hypothetical protein
MLRTIVILLIALNFCSCFEQKSLRGLHIEPNSKKLSKTKTGLKIESTPTRGTGLIDSLGSKYGIVHVTNTITNDSTIPIHLQIALPTEFTYPIGNDDLKFRIVMWPGLTEPPHLYSDDYGQLKENFAGNDMKTSNQFDILLAPGEKYDVTIGTLDYPGTPKICSAVAYSLL